MAITPANLLMGPATISTGVVGATEPPSGATALGVPWTDAGATSGGATLTIGQTYTPMPIDQIVLAAGARRTAQTITVATNLAEATLANLRLALNQAVAAATFLELDSDAVNADPNYAAVCLQGTKPGGGPRRVYLRRTLSTENIGVPFQLDGMTLVPVTFSAYYLSGVVKPLRIDDTP